MSKTIVFDLPRDFRLDPDDICVIHSRPSPNDEWEVWGACVTPAHAMHTCVMLRAYEIGATTRYLRWPE